MRLIRFKHTHIFKSSAACTCKALMLRLIFLSSADIQPPNVLFHGLTSEIFSSGMCVAMVTLFFFVFSSYSVCSSHLCYKMQCMMGRRFNDWAIAYWVNSAWMDYLNSSNYQKSTTGTLKSHFKVVILHFSKNCQWCLTIKTRHCGAKV